jgi:glutamate transport system substrate-binding protein
VGGRQVQELENITMKASVRKTVALAGVVAVALLGSACGKDSKDSAKAGEYKVESDVKLDGSPTFKKAKDRGKLVIGVKDTQPGLSFKDNTSGKYSGFDVEIARMIAADLGFDDKKIEYRPVQSANRETSIASGDIDFYVGSYSITTKRKETVSFAGPYYITGQSLLVRKDSTATGVQDMNGKKVCSVNGSTSIEKIKKDYPQVQDSFFATYDVCVENLVSKAVDAVTTDETILAGYAAKDKDNLKVIGKPFSEEKYGVGLNKDDKALRDKINDSLEAHNKNGDWKKAYDSTLGNSGVAIAPFPTIERY